MPNHFTTIAICSPGYDFNCDDFNDRHKETCLCSVVKPMPERATEIHIGSAVMEDGSRASKWTERKNESGKTVCTPTDETDWYEWSKENWGTKWGTYDMKAFPLGGDGSPIAIKFQSAWGPPKILGLIAEWLKRVGKFDRVVFIGFDPYDDSTKLLEREVIQ